MKKYAVTILALLLVALTAVGALAFEPFHGPFDKNWRPKRFRLRPCKIVEGKKKVAIPAKYGRWHGLLAGKDAVTFSARHGVVIKERVDDIAYQVYFSITRPGGETLVAEQALGDGVEPGRAYSADLNGDDIDDYIVEAGSGGQGIGEGYRYTAFVLSSESGYKVSFLKGFYPGPEDFVDIVPDGHCQVIHTSYIFGEPDKDGKRPAYWVYNLLKVDGAELKPANELDGRFPMWVEATKKPGYKAAGSLSSEQKEKLWKADGEGFFWTAGSE